MEVALAEFIRFAGSPGVLALLAWVLKEQIRQRRLLADLGTRLVSLELTVHKRPLPSGEYPAVGG